MFWTVAMLAAVVVVVLTTFDLGEDVHAALRYGAVGFLLKDASGDEMTAAVRVAAAGDATLAPRVTRRTPSPNGSRPTGSRPGNGCTA